MISFVKFYNFVIWMIMGYVAGKYMIGGGLPEEALQLGATCGLISGLELVRRLAPWLSPEEEKNEDVKE